MRILMVGCDLSSKGGIATVVKTYWRANSERKEPIELELMKTTYYEEKGKVFEFFILVKSLVVYLCKLLSREYDIIHIQTSYGFSFARKALFVFLGKLFRKRIILHIHSSKFYDFFLSQHTLLYWFCQSVFKKCDLILVLCSDWETRLRARYTAIPSIKIQTLHNPNPLKMEAFPFKQSDPSAPLKALFLGFLIESKGVLDILALARKLNEACISNIHIVMAGKGKLEQMLRKTIAEGKLGHIIDFKGWVEGEEKINLLSTADVYFLPSYNEGMPMSILEAMCCGLPVVSTKIAGIPDLVRGDVNGYLFTPGDIDGYFNALKDLSLNRAKLAELGKGSIELVRNFEADVIFDNLIGTYRVLLGRS